MFLKQTMAVAQSDKEKMLMQKMNRLAELFRELFDTADTSKDGSLDHEELHKAIGKKQIRTMLDAVELTGTDLTQLFDLLQTDGGVNQEDFVSGALRLKGTVRATDAISMMHEQAKIQHTLNSFGEGLQLLFYQLGLGDSWQFTRIAPKSVKKSS